jgi:uncharacterized protein (DUF1684 family)
MSSDRVQLADWRRRVAEMYAQVRQLDPEQGWKLYRRERDLLLKTHSQSPVGSDQRVEFQELQYYPYDPQWRLLAEIEPRIDGSTREVDLSEDGNFRITEIGQVQIRSSARLSLFWVEGYGGGLFLPFMDATNGDTTYGGGRYMIDGIKGADLGMQGNRLILDFNFAYNPSCVYDEKWVCPLPAEQNRLPFRVEAGEKEFGAQVK